VVLVTPGFSASEDDWCIPILRDFAEALAENNEVSIVALRYPDTARSYRVAGIDVQSLGGGTRTGLPKAGLLGRAVAAVVRAAKQRSADVIHSFWAHEPGAVAGVAGRLAGVPVVVTVMGGELAALPEISYGGRLAAGNRILARLSLGLADRVVALSGVVHEIVDSRIGSARLRRLDFGVPTDRFSRHEESSTDNPDQPVRFLSVGSLVPVKDHEVLLRAFAMCRNEVPASRLELIGDGQLRSDLEHQARRLGIDSSVRFTGDIDHSRIPSHMARADVLVVSSLWEGTPQVVHEALACGLPVVGTAVGILPELTGAARCVPVGDADALGREMARVASNVETRRKMAAATLAATRSLDDCIADHELLYDSIIRGRDV
jgi:glycosyltransferase involved in cell wall biosynthesis